VKKDDVDEFEIEDSEMEVMKAIIIVIIMEKRRIDISNEI